MTTFRAICTDIDGTLLDHRRQLSDTTIRVFRSLAGTVPVILASSRMPSAMRHLQQELNVMQDPLICYNGGYILRYDPQGQPEVLHSTFIPAEVCEGIVRLAVGTNVHVSLYFEDNWYAPQWDSWTEREARITKVDPTIEHATAVLLRWKATGAGGHKVMCMGPEDEMNTMEEKLTRDFSNAIHIYRSRPTYLELAPKAMSKGSGLELLLSMKYSFGVDNVISFGDNYNDIDLLSVSGAGIAVGNARSEVKAVADEITLDSTQDGVAIALQKHFALAI
jgi:Cof subfamily protein (haloacid dehalogenase superfamily)